MSCPLNCIYIIIGWCTDTYVVQEITIEDYAMLIIDYTGEINNKINLFGEIKSDFFWIPKEQISFYYDSIMGFKDEGDAYIY